jgi:hypothetical protein
MFTFLDLNFKMPTLTTGNYRNITQVSNKLFDLKIIYFELLNARHSMMNCLTFFLHGAESFLRN